MRKRKTNSAKNLGIFGTLYFGRKIEQLLVKVTNNLDKTEKNENPTNRPSEPPTDPRR